MTINDSYTQKELEELATAAHKLDEDAQNIAELAVKIMMGIEILRSLNQVDVIGEDVE